MKRHLLIAAIAVAALAASPAHAFDAVLARLTSDGLTQAQMDKAWDLFDQAQASARSGDPIAAGFAARAAALINPAEPAMHVFAATQFELGGANGKAWAHWKAAADLYGSTKQGTDALAAMNRVDVQLRQRGTMTTCKVIGHAQSAWASACDDAVLAKQYGNTSWVNTAAPDGMNVRRVSAYIGQQRSQQEVSTIVGTGETKTSPGTFICRIDGMTMPGGGATSILYVLPGDHRLGWCLGKDGAVAQGETQIRVSSGTVYQIKGYSDGASQEFMELGYRVKLTWRHFAPDRNDLPNIDGPIPYGASN